MATYRATDELNDIIKELIENDSDHYHLNKSGVRISVLMHISDGPMMCAGYPALAMIRKTAPRERALGMADAVITVDSAAWDDLEENERVELVDHELMHLAPKIKEWNYEHMPDGSVRYEDGKAVKKEAVYEYDANHRPKLDIVKHDVQVGWFVRNVEKHGFRSPERMQAKALCDRFGQLLFGFEEASETEIAERNQRHETRINNLPTVMRDDADGAFATFTREMKRQGAKVTVSTGV